MLIVVERQLTTRANSPEAGSIKRNGNELSAKNKQNKRPKTNSFPSNAAAVRNKSVDKRNFKPHSPFKQFKSQLRKLKRIRINKNYCARAPSTSPWTNRRANDGKYIKIKRKWRRTLVKSKPWHEAKLSFSVFMDKWFVTLSNKEDIGVHKKERTSKQIPST